MNMIMPIDGKVRWSVSTSPLPDFAIVGQQTINNAQDRHQPGFIFI